MPISWGRPRTIVPRAVAPILKTLRHHPASGAGYIDDAEVRVDLENIQRQILVAVGTETDGLAFGFPSVFLGHGAKDHRLSPLAPQMRPENVHADYVPASIREHKTHMSACLENPIFQVPGPPQQDTLWP